MSPVRFEPVVRRVGLARVISKLGYCSRSEAARLIRAGQVTLNGKLCNHPETPVHQGCDRIEIDGAFVRRQSDVYLMLNKPRGIVTTASDEKGRETVYSLLDPSLPWVAPVGRLDKASEGLLLLTNDSEWAGRIQAPETHLGKTYHVQIDAIADAKLLAAMQRGIKTVDGEVLRARQVSILRTGEKNCWLEITLDEGKNRHIRRMLEGVNIEVLRLIRVAIGPLKLGSLSKGRSRSLTREEKSSLDHAMKRKT